MKKKPKNGKRNNHHPVIRREPEFPTLPERIENALIDGNLSDLTSDERVKLYLQTCKSLKLNPLTKPFGYILLKDWKGVEKLVLYATRNCTDQLRSIYGASDVPNSLKREYTATELIAEIAVQGRNGRISQDVGVIPLKQERRDGSEYTLTGKTLANAKMHVVTKARRRATLALYGLGGIVDESELDTMNVVGGVTKEGRIWRYVAQAQPETRILEEGMEYPKGAPRAAQAAAQLAKVEAADKEFASGRHPAESRQAPASKPAQSQPAEGQKAGTQPSVQAGKGEGAKPSPSSASSPETTTQGFYRPPGSVQGRSGEVSGAAKGIRESGKSNAPTGSNSVPQARIPHKIVNLKKTKSGKGWEVELDTGHKLYAFDNFKTSEDGEKFFDILEKAAGKTAIFVTKATETQDKHRFMNITGVIQLGEREWEDGVPILRRAEYEGREF